jgi:hypothetical protein
MLALGQIGNAPPADHLGHHGATKPLVLALGLRMVWPAVTDRDDELEQPHPEGGVAVRRIRLSPRRAVIHQHALGQPIAPEDRRQPGLHRARTLVAAGPEPNGVTQVVVITVSGWQRPTRVAKCPS